MIVVVGEALVDVLVREDGSRTEAPGGSCLNVAVAASRLGTETTLLTEIGEDAYGRLLRTHAEDSGVTMVADEPRTGRSASATATIDADGTATYDFDLDWALRPQRLPDGVVLHTGSLGSALTPGADTVADLAEQASGRGALVTYDPNARPAFVDDPADAWSAVRTCAARADLVKLSDEDCAVLCPGADVDEVARTLLAGRTRLVVVTRGGDGSTAYAEGLEVHADPVRVDVADTVGAGDTFTAGLVVALVDLDLLDGDAWHTDETVVRRLLASAAAAAAVTVTRAGANPPTRAELGTWPTA